MNSCQFRTLPSRKMRMVGACAMPAVLCMLGVFFFFVECLASSFEVHAGSTLPTAVISRFCFVTYHRVFRWGFVFCTCLDVDGVAFLFLRVRITVVGQRGRFLCNKKFGKKYKPHPRRDSASLVSS